MNRIINVLKVMVMLCITACGGEDEPTPPTSDEPTAFEYNHTPLNDYLISFAGETDKKSTERVLDDCVYHYNAQRKALIGSSLNYLSSMRFTMDRAIEGGWVNFRPTEIPYINNIPISFLVLVELSDDEVKEFSNLNWNTQYELSGTLHDFSMQFISETVTVKSHLDYSVAISNATIKICKN